MEENASKYRGQYYIAIISIFIAIGVGVALVAFIQKSKQASNSLNSQIILTNESLQEMKGIVSILKEKTEKNQEAILQMAIDNYLKKDGQVGFY